MFSVMKQIPALIELSSIRPQLSYSETTYKAQNLGGSGYQFLAPKYKAQNQELHSGGGWSSDLPKVYNIFGQLKKSTNFNKWTKLQCFKLFIAIKPIYRNV